MQKTRKSLVILAFSGLYICAFVERYAHWLDKTNEFRGHLKVFLMLAQSCDGVILSLLHIRVQILYVFWISNQSCKYGEKRGLVSRGEHMQCEQDIFISGIVRRIFRTYSIDLCLCH